MGQRETPVVRQRRLRAELRHFRQEAGHTQRAVAEAVGWSVSKVIRVETGAVTVSTADVMALLHYYGVTDTRVIDELLAVTRIKENSWWDEYRSFFRKNRDFFSQQFLNFLGYEDSAIRIREYMSLLVPGLMQTEQYACALVADYKPSHERIGTEIRMQRQKLLDSPDCPRLWYVLDEAVLHRWVGGPEVMLGQLDRLKELARHPRIRLQIVPFPAGLYAGLRGSSFTIFDFTAADSVVTVEDPHRDAIIHDPDISSDYIRKFSTLQEIACPLGEVDKFIDPVIDRMRLGTKG